MKTLIVITTTLSIVFGRVLVLAGDDQDILRMRLRVTDFLLLGFFVPSETDPLLLDFVVPCWEELLEVFILKSEFLLLFAGFMSSECIADDDFIESSLAAGFRPSADIIDDDCIACIFRPSSNGFLRSKVTTGTFFLLVFFRSELASTYPFKFSQQNKYGLKTLLLHFKIW